MKSDKVQTCASNVNVLVETKNSTNPRMSPLGVEVNVSKVLTEEEIVELWENRKEDDKLELATKWIRKQKGYACSNCTDDTLNINYKSIVKYETQS